MQKGTGGNIKFKKKENEKFKEHNQPMECEFNTKNLSKVFFFKIFYNHKLNVENVCACFLNVKSAFSTTLNAQLYRFVDPTITQPQAPFIQGEITHKRQLTQFQDFELNTCQCRYRRYYITKIAWSFEVLKK